MNVVITSKEDEVDLQTITMPEEAAREAFTEYRKAVTGSAHEKLGEARREYEKMDRAVMRGYKHLIAGRKLLNLSQAISVGGVEIIETEQTYWDAGRKTRTISVTMPRLAVCRADARHCLSEGVQGDGSITFIADERWSRARRDFMRFAAGTLERQDGATSSYLHSAIVPTIPPQLRPEHNLSGYHILWEAEWTAAPPVDPALLKHIDGYLYAVLAVWDLTDLEQTVLAGMRTQ